MHLLPLSLLGYVDAPLWCQKLARESFELGRGFESSSAADIQLFLVYKSKEDSNTGRKTTSWCTCATRIGAEPASRRKKLEVCLNVDGIAINSSKSKHQKYTEAQLIALEALFSLSPVVHRSRIISYCQVSNLLSNKHLLSVYTQTLDPRSESEWELH